jgi:hypothetical protein
MGAGEVGRAETLKTSRPCSAGLDLQSRRRKGIEKNPKKGLTRREESRALGQGG